MDCNRKIWYNLHTTTYDMTVYQQTRPKQEKEVFQISIGQRIEEARKQHGYSQEYLAEKLNVSRQAVSKWEQNKSAPDTGNLIALSQLLNVTVEYLATGKTENVSQASPVQEDSNAHRKFTVQQIAGLIFLGAGLEAVVFGVLFSRVLFSYAIYMFASAALCIFVRKRLWLAFLITFPILLFFFH